MDIVKVKAEIGVIMEPFRGERISVKPPLEGRGCGRCDWSRDLGSDARKPCDSTTKSGDVRPNLAEALEEVGGLGMEKLRLS